MYSLSSQSGNKILIFPIPICQIYMVSYLSSFRLVFSVINIFRNRLHGKDFRFRMPVSPGALAVIGHSGYVQMIKKLTKKCFCMQVIYRCTSTFRL
jgi:hypothetical protein